MPRGGFRRQLSAQRVYLMEAGIATPVGINLQRELEGWVTSRAASQISVRYALTCTKEFPQTRDGRG
jgi:hypothetical protein